MKLSVVIVNYNVKYYLEQCLRALLRATEGVECEVLVVDNASEDGSMEYLKPRFPHVVWTECKENGGFSHGNNIGFSRARGEYILMLNPDTIVTKEAIEGCVRFMDEHPEVGVSGVKMINKDGTFAMESRRGIVKPWVAFCKATGLCRRYPHSRLFGHYYMSYLDVNEANPIEMVSGAFMFLRHDTLRRVGTLDEEFFMYWEDSDLSYRILKSGEKNYYLPYTIFHYKGESSIKSKLRYRYWLYSSLQTFFKKHFPLYNILFYLPIKLAVAVLKFRIHHAYPMVYGKNWEQYNEPPKRFLVIAGEQACEQIKNICRKNNLGENHSYVVATEAAAPRGHLAVQDIKGFTHVLYDAEAYSYDTILSLLQQTPGNALRLATYSAETGNLITEDAIYN